MRNDYDFINEASDNKHILNIFITLLKEIAGGIKETNEIRKKEQTELWKEVKDIKINVNRISEDLYRESDVRPGIIQKLQNNEIKISKLEKINCMLLGAVLLINAIPLIKDFLNLLTK